MIEIPSEIQKAMDLALYSVDAGVRKFAWKILSSALERHGLRWEYFV